MTGRISVLAAPDKPGIIIAHNGFSRFNYAYRLPIGKTDGLAMGRLVSFELEKGSSDIAISVCPTGDLSASSQAGPNSRREVRYQGFEQTNNIRKYRFHAWRAGEENQEAIVTVDLALFRKHGISLQEGPGLCFRLVEAELQEPSQIETTVWNRKLTDQEMLAHVAARLAPARKRG
jgi:hypothetical protein